jgi:argininosuccinate synthase
MMFIPAPSGSRVLEDPRSGRRNSTSPGGSAQGTRCVEIDFEGVIRSEINEETVSPATLLRQLNDIGGRHGIDRSLGPT